MSPKTSKTPQPSGLEVKAPPALDGLLLVVTVALAPALNVAVGATVGDGFVLVEVEFWASNGDITCSLISVCFFKIRWEIIYPVKHMHQSIVCTTFPVSYSVSSK
jgi:hypothetical protein